MSDRDQDVGNSSVDRVHLHGQRTVCGARTVRTTSARCQVRAPIPRVVTVSFGESRLHATLIEFTARSRTTAERALLGSAYDRKCDHVVPVADLATEHRVLKLHLEPLGRSDTADRADCAAEHGCATFELATVKV
jgi:hypothetical protein